MNIWNNNCLNNYYSIQNMESTKQRSELIQNFTSAFSSFPCRKEPKDLFMRSYFRTVFLNTADEVNYVQVAEFMEKSWKELMNEIDEGRMFVKACYETKTLTTSSSFDREGDADSETKLTSMCFYKILNNEDVFVNYISNVDGFDPTINSSLLWLSYYYPKSRILFANRKVYKTFESVLNSYNVDKIPYEDIFPFGTPETHDYFVLRKRL